MKPPLHVRTTSVVSSDAPVSATATVSGSAETISGSTETTELFAVESFFESAILPEAGSVGFFAGVFPADGLFDENYIKPYKP